MENNESAEKLDFILNETAELFRKYGIRSISMDDIARELGMSKKTLYQFVSSKADLLEKGFQKFHENFVMSVREICNHNLNAIDELLEVSKLVNVEYKKYNPSGVFDLQKYYPEIFNKHIKEEKQFTYDMIIQNLQKGIRQGLYRGQQDIELVAGLYIQKVESIHTEKFMNQAGLSMDKIFEVMFENHIRGISNLQGIAYFEERKQQLKFE
ncbi:MAG: TetR/AcrR family transcriptional regulator [Bacteroidales bacterium]|nr:TetR/AcrR family transcriptional regulator [Bacteroidales bacterium]